VDRATFEKWTLDYSEHKEALICPLGCLPGRPVNDRVLCRPWKVSERTGLIILPEEAKHFRAGGWLVAAGLSALDKLHDQDIHIGDEVMWGKYAHLLVDWDHIAVAGNDPSCDHWHPESDVWSGRTVTGGNVYKMYCERCDAIRVIEPLSLLNVDDVQVCVTLERAIFNGQKKVVTVMNDKKQTTHIIRSS
jgi:co-chaperonin GroES (HSP10)